MPARRSLRRRWALAATAPWATWALLRATGSERGFPLVPDVELEPGASDPAVGVLRRRLMRSGDLTGESGYLDHFGSDLDAAVKRFQASNGLAPTGMVDKRTIAALNVPSEVRLAQLKTNLERLTDLTKIVAKRYVLVNIPAAVAIRYVAWRRKPPAATVAYSNRIPVPLPCPCRLRRTCPTAPESVPRRHPSPCPTAPESGPRRHQSARP